jgi:preprotein translocase subunit SecD
VTIDATDFVPMVLSRAPEPIAEPDGRIRLNVTLSQKHVSRLEDFTRRHLGGRVALVLDGELISVHKIRAIIPDGRLQITRCGDRACDKILAKLSE